MPIRRGLEQPGCLYDRGVSQRRANELDTHRKAMRAEAARNTDGRQPADIANATDGVGKAQHIIEIGVEPAGDDRKRGRNQHVTPRTRCAVMKSDALISSLI